MHFDDIPYSTWRCEVDLTTGLARDTRYKLGPELFSESDHFEQNNITHALNSLPYPFMKSSDSLDTPPGFSLKENMMVGAVRHTLSYKLECENLLWGEDADDEMTSRQSLV